jgi:hypothetical protein
VPRQYTNTGPQLDQRSAFHSVVDKTVVGYARWRLDTIL